MLTELKFLGIGAFSQWGGGGGPSRTVSRAKIELMCRRGIGGENATKSTGSIDVGEKKR